MSGVDVSNAVLSSMWRDNRHRRKRQHEPMGKAQHSIRDRSHARAEHWRRVESHDDEPRITIARDLGDLLGRFAVCNQRFGLDARRHLFERTIEILLGPVAPFGFDLRQPGRRRDRGAHRFDDVK